MSRRPRSTETGRYGPGLRPGSIPVTSHSLQITPSSQTIPTRTDWNATKDWPGQGGELRRSPAIDQHPNASKRRVCPPGASKARFDAAPRSPLRAGAVMRPHLFRARKGKPASLRRRRHPQVGRCAAPAFHHHDLEGSMHTPHTPVHHPGRSEHRRSAQQRPPGSRRWRHLCHAGRHARAQR